MKLGLLTAPFEDVPLMEVADWAGANGFSAFEVACWPASGGESGAMRAPAISMSTG